MRRFLLNLSIKSKLVAMMTLAATAALLFACSTFVIYELGTYRGAAAAEARAAAQIVAGTSTASLAFDDGKAGVENLEALRGEAHIQEAALFRPDGSPLARYARTQPNARIPLRRGPDGARFEGDYLIVFQPATLNGERIGTVYLKRDLADVRERLTRYGGVALLVLLISPLVALVVSSLLQRWVSRPLRRLALAASRVSAESNYSIRATKTAQDEIGTLVDRFNEMLGQVQQRDEALRAARDELEDRVRDRTLQLQNEIAERKIIERDLLAAKEAAEAASRAKSMFLANMSHELRTPLNAIIGYSELLQEEAGATAHKALIPDLVRIHGSGKHLLRLIGDVLDLSKIDAGHMSVDLEDVTVGSLLDDVAGTAELLAHKNHNRFQIICADRDAVMYVDPLRFRQSLLNLLANAAKFTEHGQVSLRVQRGVKQGQEGFDWTVADTGIGIPPGQIDKLFKSFSQVDGSNARNYGGTGLGLAISQRLCQMMGGEITVESELGRGSRFSIHLPAAPDSRPKIAPDHAPGLAA